MSIPRWVEEVFRNDKILKATPEHKLYARYKTEKTIALAARKTAEQAVYDRGFYDLRVEATQQRATQLAAARRDHPLPTWDAFLSREAGRGDREAARLLEQRQEKVREQEQER